MNEELSLLPRIRRERRNIGNNALKNFSPFGGRGEISAIMP
jgi:hypothetical protein